MSENFENERFTAFLNFLSQFDGECDVVSPSLTLLSVDKMMEKQKIFGKSNDLVHLVYRFTDAIKHSFESGYAKTFGDVLVRLLLPEKQDYSALEYSSCWAGFRLSQTYNTRFRSTTNCSVKNYKTQTNRSNMSGSSSSSDACGITPNKNEHNKHIPDMVYTYLDGSPYMFWEFKNNGGDIYRAISELVSFGLSYRCHKKTSYKIILVAITPYNWAYAVLPPFGDPLKDIAFMSQKVGFDKKDKKFINTFGLSLFLKNIYAEIPKNLDEFGFI